MLMCEDLFCLLTHDEVDNIIATEVLLDEHNDLQDGNQLVHCLNLCLRMQTVVAIATVILVVGFTKIVEEHLSTTYARLGIGSRLYEQLTTYILLCHRLSLHELLQFVEVLAGIECQTDSLTAITTGTTCLLIVSLQRLGDIIMDHKAHIGFIDTHTEGDGSHYHVDILHKEGILCLGPRGRVKTCVISRGLDIIGSKDSSQLFYLLSRETVDDTALAGVLLDEFYDILVHILGLRTYLIVEVGTVEGTLKLRGILYSQILLDIRTYLVCCRCREGNDRCTTYLIDNRTDTTILRTEVMTPL